MSNERLLFAFSVSLNALWLSTRSVHTDITHTGHRECKEKNRGGGFEK